MTRYLLAIALAGCGEVPSGEAEGIAPEPRHEPALAAEPTASIAPEIVEEPEVAEELGLSLVLEVGGAHYVVLADDFDASDLEGPTTAFLLDRAESLGILGRPAHGTELPGSLAGGAALYGTGGLACEAALGSPIAMVRAEMPWELSARWRGEDPENLGPRIGRAEVEQELWNTFSSAALLVAPVDAPCEGALYAMPRGTTPAARFTPAADDPSHHALAVEALALFRQREAYEVMATDYAQTYGTEDLWDEDEEVFERTIRVFEDPSGKQIVVVAAVVQEEGCGGLESMWVGFAREGNALREILGSDYEDPPAAILDTNGDGAFELLFTTPSGSYSRSADSEEPYPFDSTVPPSVDCPC
jgi:hypothetical protein